MTIFGDRIFKEVNEVISMGPTCYNENFNVIIITSSVYYSFGKKRETLSSLQNNEEINFVV